MAQKTVLIVSGEPSGDLHASNLVKDILSLQRDVRFYGMGGSLSKEAGVDIVYDITKLALVGAVEVLKHLSTVKQAHDRLLQRIDSDRPELAILVDYPGFNLKLACDLGRRNIPVAYYVSPQIWAWAPQRIRLIRRYVRKMVVFFSFEEELYRQNGVAAEFVGHPLLDVVKVTSPRDETRRRYGLDEKKTVIAILPGSRVSEIKVFMPILASAARLMREKLGGVQFIVSKHPSRPAAMYENALAGAGLDYRLAEGDLYNIVGAADFAVVASGTATLETAIVGTPHILVYRANLITYALYRMVRTIPYLGIVNVVAKREVTPELIQYAMTPRQVADTTVSILTDRDRLKTMRRDLAAVKAALGQPGARMRAARAILPLLQ